MAERTKLDRAIIFRPPGLKTVAAIMCHFALQEKYELSAEEVTAYAEKVEQLVRPEVTSQVMAGVLGCLPKAYRRQLVAGGEVLLVSRVLQALNTQETGLTVAEMAKLASIPMSLARRSGSEQQGGVGGGRVRKSRSGQAHGGDDPSAEGGGDPIKLAESVRLLYGLSWPPGDSERDSNSSGIVGQNRMETQATPG
jgi:hypothetical protein